MIPRGIRNNNPLNIRRSKDQWQGMKKTQSDSSFCQFETFEDGWRAAFVLLTRTYYQKMGLGTIRAIVERWAPPNENNTAAYVNYCARQLCYSAHSPLKLSQDYCRLGVAMAWMETATKLTADDIWKVMKKYNIFIV